MCLNVLSVTASKLYNEDADLILNICYIDYM
jgi:hypothetical protein